MSAGAATEVLYAPTATTVAARVGVGTRVRVRRMDGASAGEGVIERVDERSPERGWVLRALVRLDDGTGVVLDALGPRNLYLEMV